MPTLPIYQVDAFTDRVFAGNPAAVCLLEGWPDDATLLAIARENNLSETAFFAPEPPAEGAAAGAPAGAPVGAPAGGGFRLRWFTPVKEVSLCGHATLASAFVVFTELGLAGDTVRFETLSGPLWVRQEGPRLVMDFPARRLEWLPEPPEPLLRGLGLAPEAAYAVVPGRSVVAVYADEETVRAVRPDFVALAELGGGIGITAPGRASDCASRYFAPSHGVPEDPVTGSIHCALVPYWAARLGKRQIHARQVSARGGDLYCEDRGERVLIAGQAVKFMQGQIQY